MEEKLWVNGPLELLEHGIKHIKEGNEFDLRIEYFHHVIIVIRSRRNYPFQQVMCSK